MSELRGDIKRRSTRPRGGVEVDARTERVRGKRRPCHDPVVDGLGRGLRRGDDDVQTELGIGLMGVVIVDGGGADVDVAEPPPRVSPGRPALDLTVDEGLGQAGAVPVAVTWVDAASTWAR